MKASASRTRLVFTVISVLLVSALILNPSLLLAQDSGIRVLESTRQNNFPDGISFNLTTEADQEIQQVRLNYRITGSRVWSYSNADFEPGQRITANFTGLIGNAVYLPPGTWVEYFYIIQDSLGRALETPVEYVAYTDNRFDWEEVQVGLLTLNYHDLRESDVTAVARELQSDLNTLIAILELDEPQPIKGFIYNSREEAAPAFPFYSRTITERQVFHGFAFPERDVFLGIGLQPRLILHESAHLMLAQSLESSVRPIPSWLDEGFASYVEPGSQPYSGQSLSSQGLHLRAMAAVSGTPEDIEHFYLKSESVVAYLVEQHGGREFQKFLTRLRLGGTIDEALMSTYGFDLDGLDANWAASDQGRSLPSPRRFSPETPFVLFNSWFLGLLILAVMAVVFLRFIYRKFRPSDDDHYDWDD